MCVCVLATLIFSALLPISRHVTHTSVIGVQPTIIIDVSTSWGERERGEIGGSLLDK